MAENDEVELDFRALPDRFAAHFEAEEMDEIEVPPYWESEKDLDELYSRESLDKAIKLVLNKRVKSAGREGLYQVEGSELYVCCIVEIEDSKVPGITCTCPNGSNRSGRPTCYHSCAVLMVHTKADLVQFQMKLIDGTVI